MIHSQKDLSILLTKKEALTVHEIVIILAQIETRMAHNPDLVPLDVFLNYTQFVHKWHTLYSESIYWDAYFSYNKFRRMIIELKDWHQDISKNCKEKDNTIVIEIVKAMQKAQNLWTNITVESAKQTGNP